MNAIHKILAINEKELLLNVSDHASWHADYNDTSYIYIGNLHESLVEKDILIIFSQYGNPTHINLVKDRDTGKSRGFCYLKYEDQRSCILAIDNFNGSLIYEKPLKVDHTYYRLAKGQQEDDFKVEYPGIVQTNPHKQIESAPKLLPYNRPIPCSNDKEEIGLISGKNTSNSVGIPGIEPPSINDDDFSDPMATLTKNDDDFEDPMAGFVKLASAETKSRRSSRKHESKREKKPHGEHEHRSKRHRYESTDAKVNESKNQVITED